MADVNVIMTAFVAFVAAFSFAIIYLGKALQQGQALDIQKFVTTLVVGVILGLIAAFSGVIPSDADLATQFAYYMSLVVGVEGLIKIVWNQITGSK